MPRAPLPLTLYGAVTRVVGKPATFRAQRRLAGAGVPRDRLGERDGYATATRPPGPMVWFHGASVGETLSILPLVLRMADVAILVTSGTATSAQVLSGRLPAGALHQFAPVDHPGAVKRFLDHWHPDLAVFAESEIWPGLLTRAAARGVPLALVNARLSARSLGRWARMPATARALFGLFDVVTVQDDRTARGLAPFLRKPAAHAGNLKAAAPLPPADDDALARWRALLGARPVWLAASTHPADEQTVLDAHEAVRAAIPDALLILAPRHPERAPAIASRAASRFEVARLSLDARPGPDTAVLLADTVGEMGLWYRLSPVVFLGGSLGAEGGHNPWEAAGLGAALLHGPRVDNAAADYARLGRAGAAETVRDAAGLAGAVTRLLTTPAVLSARQDAARGAVTGAGALADAVAAELTALLCRR